MPREKLNQSVTSLSASSILSKYTGKGSCVRWLTGNDNGANHIGIGTSSPTAALAVNGIILTNNSFRLNSVTGLKANRIEVKDEICVDGTCLNADDIRALLNQTGREASSPAAQDADTEPTPTSETTVTDPILPEESVIEPAPEPAPNPTGDGVTL